uniref:hypothetical protein n=1 Tax=Castellaniella defragrans TaxID=75697 RepID=UPI00334092DC
MYRLPSPFEPAGSQDDLAAAGGGSTTTSCCCCLVTLGAASAATAALFFRLAPPADASASAGAENPDKAADASAGGIQMDRDGMTAGQPGRPMPAWLRAVLGVLAPWLAIAIAAEGGTVSVNSEAFFLLVPVLFLVTYLGMFALVYARSNRSAARGIGIGILMLIGIAVCAVLEMFIWVAR